MPKNEKGREIAEIIPDKCIACEACLGACPTDAIVMENGVAKIDPTRCTGCGKCFDACPAGAVLYERIRKKKVAAQAAAPPERNEGVAVFIETQEGHGADVAWELVGKARELAAKINTRVLGFLLGNGVDEVAGESIEYGCDVVYTIDDPMLASYLPKTYGKGLVSLCNQVKPEIFLLGATPLGRDLASVVATQLQTGLTADCTGLDVDPTDRLLLMTRPTFGGNIMATILCRNWKPQMSTVRPRVMEMPKKEAGRQGEIKRLDFEPPEGVLPKLIESIPVPVGGEDITKAPVLVSIGKGACDPKYVPMFEELAGILAGTISCSRPVVEAGLLPYSKQVGQTGKTVAPKLYIGVGISGAVQHLVGIQGAKTIVAINIDANAPLVRVSDYALVGDFSKVVPALIEGLKARVGRAREKVTEG